MTDELEALLAGADVVAPWEMDAEMLRACCATCALQADALVYRHEVPEWIDIGGEA